MAIQDHGVSYICDECSKAVEEKEKYKGPEGWIEVAVEKEPEPESQKRYLYDEYNFCSWECSARFASRKAGLRLDTTSYDGIYGPAR